MGSKEDKKMIKGQYRIWEDGEYCYGHAFGFVPKIISYLHGDSEDRPCIVVVPGGGYAFVSPSEGEPVARKFYGMGYQVFVLVYTTNLAHQIPLKSQPLQDISRAVRYIRKNAGRFHILTDKVAVCGFSAGGHLCASLCVHYKDVQDLSAEYAGIKNRPDAAVLSYPVISSGEYAHKDSFVCLLGPDATKGELGYMSLENHVKKDMPPVFLWTTVTDDTVPAQNSELFAKACKDNGAVCALHMFSYGGHGLSVADESWANMEYEDEGTLEQHNKVLDKVFAGELDVPDEVLAPFLPKEGGQEAPGRQPNAEAAVWPVAVDAFLKDVYR